MVAVAEDRPGRAQPEVLAAIAAGGMLGATARYAISRALPTELDHFPWATFWTNVAGSLVLGFAVALLVAARRPPRLLRPFLTTGIIGAFTTMSTYSVETAVLVKDGHAATGAVYCATSIGAGLGLAALGLVTGRGLARRRHRRA